MNLPRIYLIAILLLAFGVGANGQEPAKAVLVDEVETDNCEVLLSSLDGFIGRLAQAKSKGSVLFTRTDDRVRDAFLFRFVLYHRANPYGPEQRYDVIPVEASGKPRFQMWIGSPPPPLGTDRIELSYNLDLSNSTRSVFFSGELYELFHNKGKSEFSEVGSGCSTRPVNLGLLSQFLDKTPKSKAYFVVRGSRRQFNQLKTYLTREATSQGLNPARTRFIYSGSRMINSRQFVEVEIFISRIETRSAASFPYNLGAN